MPIAAGLDAAGKFQRYQARKRALGLKQVRVWAPDPLAPGFSAEAERQAQILRGAAEEAEALDVIEAAGAWQDEVV
jgi:hypothetical protein